MLIPYHDRRLITEWQTLHRRRQNLATEKKRCSCTDESFMQRALKILHAVTAY
jgi:hypothetical protein